MRTMLRMRIEGPETLGALERERLPAPSHVHAMLLRKYVLIHPPIHTRKHTHTHTHTRTSSAARARAHLHTHTPCSPTPTPAHESPHARCRPPPADNTAKSEKGFAPGVKIVLVTRHLRCFAPIKHRAPKSLFSPDFHKAAHTVTTWVPSEGAR
jgi:hypothetical protein